MFFCAAHDQPTWFVQPTSLQDAGHALKLFAFLRTLDTPLRKNCYLLPIFQAKRISSAFTSTHDSSTSSFGSSASLLSVLNVPISVHSPMTQSCTVFFLRYHTAPWCSCKVTTQKLSQNNNTQLKFLVWMLIDMFRSLS